MHGWEWVRSGKLRLPRNITGTFHPSYFLALLSPPLLCGSVSCAIDSFDPVSSAKLASFFHAAPGLSRPRFTVPTRPGRVWLSTIAGPYTVHLSLPTSQRQTTTRLGIGLKNKNAPLFQNSRRIRIGAKELHIQSESPLPEAATQTTLSGRLSRFRKFPTLINNSGQPYLLERYTGRDYRLVENLTDIMESSVQILSTPTADTPGTSLMLQAGVKRYIFGNQAEGTQRAINQMGSKIVKVSDIFVTGRSEWSNLGGLLGMAITLADTTGTAYKDLLKKHKEKEMNNRSQPGPKPVRPKMYIHGPPNLKHVLATGRRFIFRNGAPIVATEFREGPTRKNEKGEIEPTWHDDQIAVWAVTTHPTRSSINTDSLSAMESKKRTFDQMFNNFTNHLAPDEETAEDREVRYDGIRTSVINHMFDSDWSFDTLIERHISDVEMPAAMFIRNPETGQLDRYRGPMPGSDRPLPDIKVLTRTPWPGARVQHLPPTEPAMESVSYIVRAHPMRGKFDPQKAKALGLKPGLQFKEIAEGKSVVNNAGETITPEMILGPTRPGQGFAIIDVPSVEYVESLINREEWSNEDLMRGINAFVWSLNPGVAQHPPLQQFIKKMDNVEHIFSSRDHCPNQLMMTSAATQTAHLNQIDEKRYSVPIHDNSTLPQVTFASPQLSASKTPPGIITAKRGLRICMMPRSKITNEEVTQVLDIANAKGQVPEQVREIANAVREEINRDKAVLDSWKVKVPHPDAEIITLGTGSALPSRTRNVSATLVRVPGIGNYLLDCGENTLGQLQRVFPPEELSDVLRNLRMIWISHLHADHHLGTVSVIKAWYQIVHQCVPSAIPASLKPDPDSGASPALAVISHNGMTHWLHEYSSVEDFGYSRILPLEITVAGPNKSIPWRSNLFRSPQLENTDFDDPRNHVQREDYPALFGFAEIDSVAVAHCRGAKAVSITFPPSPTSEGSTTPDHPFKVSYSGDCRPSEEFVQIGMNSTVLIHESTFEDELRKDARHKKHSTSSEALLVGARMKARTVVLTHFSQRYQKMVMGQGEDDKNTEPVENCAVGTSAEEPAAPIDAENPDVEMSDNGLEDQDTEMQDGTEVDGDGGNVDIYKPPPAPTYNIKLTSHVTFDFMSMEEIKAEVKQHMADMKVAISFDYMRVRVGEIPECERFIPAMNRWFEILEERGELDEEQFGEVNRVKVEHRMMEKKRKEEKMKKEQEKKEKREKGKGGKGRNRNGKVEREGGDASGEDRSKVRKVSDA